jgi:2OG-Fe(II) oxygenase superfamily
MQVRHFRNSPMPRDLTADYSALFADRIRLPKRIEELRNTYRNALPFPHVVIDELFSPDILDPLLGEMAAMPEEQWRVVDTAAHERTRRMRSGVELGAAGTQLVGLLHSASFLYLLSEITGVWQLLPDPYLQGAGYAQMQPGDFFNIHSDRNIAYQTGLHRRLAMIVFLNKSWDPKYNGQLELWNVEGTRRDVSIDPLYNRTVLFEVANPNYHGVPAPIACPADRSRQSFIVYYHTVGLDGKLDVAPHSSIFAPSFHRADGTLRSFAREVTPPVLLKAAKKLATLFKPTATRSP